MQKIFRTMRKHGLIVADNGSDMYITGTYDPRWNNDVLNPAFSKLTADDFEVIQLGYNPPTKPAAGAARHLRASVEGAALRLVWDKEDAAVVFRIETTDQPAAGGWRTAAETSENVWSGPMDSSSGAQFYRVLFVGH